MVLSPSNYVQQAINRAGTNYLYVSLDRRFKCLSCLNDPIATCSTCGNLGHPIKFYKFKARLDVTGLDLDSAKPGPVDTGSYDFYVGEKPSIVVGSRICSFTQRPSSEYVLSLTAVYLVTGVIIEPSLPKWQKVIAKLNNIENAGLLSSVQAQGYTNI